MKYYGDAEITGKATVDGVLTVNDNVNIGGHLEAAGGVSFSGDSSFSNGNFSFSGGDINFDIGLNSFIVKIDDSKEYNIKLYKNSNYSIFDTNFSTITLRGDNFTLMSKSSIKLKVDSSSGDLITYCSFRSAGSGGSINADKVKINSSYYSMSYSNGVLTFTS